MERTVAGLEVLLASDFPTQFALAATFTALGYRPIDSQGQLNVGFVVGLSLADTVALIGLILLFLYTHGESPKRVFLGRRSFSGEAAFGVPLIVVALTIGLAVLLFIQRFVPSLHTVEHNPLQGLLKSPGDAWLFGFVVIVAGGLREEIQRAFLLHRFETHLGGAGVGIVVTSVVFGAGHFELQGGDAAVATGLLGAFWGLVYLRRRSFVAPMVSHAGFDVVQILQFMMLGR